MHTVYTVSVYLNSSLKSFIVVNLAAGGNMERPKSFSPGLLYSISPGSLPSLHLRDEAETNGLDWEAHKAEDRRESISLVILSVLRKTAAHWGLHKHQ